MMQRKSRNDIDGVLEWLEACLEMSAYNGREGQVIFDHTMVEKISGMFVPRTISIIFACTGNFRKDISDCFDDVDRWLFLLKHSTRMKDYSDSFQSEVFRRVLEVLEIGSFTQEEFNMYYSEEEQKKIRQAQDETVRRIGREEGFAEGREEGFAEGQAKGREEANRANALRMLAKGMSVEDVSDITGLSAEEIATL